MKELMAAMERTGTKKLTLKKEDYELTLERGESDVCRNNKMPLEFVEPPVYQHYDNVQRANAALAKGNEHSVSLVHSPSTASSDKDEAAYQYVTSPMVGTFYVSPTPGDPVFVKAGDKIEKHTVVCIIEAMKVMNEVKAGVSGTVVEQLVEDGHPVEFGTKLFRIS